MPHRMTYKSIAAVIEAAYRPHYSKVKAHVTQQGAIIREGPGQSRILCVARDTEEALRFLPERLRIDAERAALFAQQVAQERLRSAAPALAEAVSALLTFMAQSIPPNTPEYETLQTQAHAALLLAGKE